MGRQTQYLLLCEDKQHENVMRYFLLACGVSDRKIRVLPYKPGQGAADQRVVNSFVREVKAFRSKRYQRSGDQQLRRIALIVMLDADHYTVDERRNQLNRHLQQANLLTIQESDNIVLLIPKRNIETWLAALTSDDISAIDEKTNYRHSLPERPIWKAALQRLAERRTQDDAISNQAPPSLVTAWQNVRQFIQNQTS